MLPHNSCCCPQNKACHILTWASVCPHLASHLHTNTPWCTSHQNTGMTSCHTSHCTSPGSSPRRSQHSGRVWFRNSYLIGSKLSKLLEIKVCYHTRIWKWLWGRNTVFQSEGCSYFLVIFISTPPEYFLCSSMTILLNHSGVHLSFFMSLCICCSP